MNFSAFSNRALTFILLSLVLVSGVFSQTKTRISGQIEHPNGSALFLVWDPSYLDEKPMRVSLPVTEGKFEYAFVLDTYREVILEYGLQKVKLFLKPGEEAILRFHADAMNLSAEFSGMYGPQHKFLRDFYKVYDKNFGRNALEQEKLSQSIDVFELDLYAQRENQLKMLNESPEKARFTPEFVTWMTKQIQYNYRAQLMSFPVVRSMSSKQTTMSHIPAVMLSEFDLPNLSQDAMLGVPAYRDFVWYAIAYASIESNGMVKWPEINQYCSARMKIANDRLRGDVRPWYLATLISTHGEEMAVSVMKTVYASLTVSDTRKFWAPVIGDVYRDKLNSKEDTPVASGNNGTVSTTMITGAGGPSSGGTKHKFHMIDMEGNPVSLDKYAGKVVYVDFWASWCGPCRGQFPFAKTLHERFDKKQLKKLVFLYISIDKNEQVWKESVIKLGLIGEHSFSPGGWGSEACKYFQINSIPRYMLINKNGEIVDKNAKRPGAEGIYEDILKLLEE